MEQQGKLLQDMTLIELKATVWDLSRLMSNTEIQIKRINDLIEKKSAEAPKEEVKE